MISKIYRFCCRRYFFDLPAKLLRRILIHLCVAMQNTLKWRNLLRRKCMRYEEAGNNHGQEKK